MFMHVLDAVEKCMHILDAENIVMHVLNAPLFMHRAAVVHALLCALTSALDPLPLPP